MQMKRNSLLNDVKVVGLLPVKEINFLVFLHFLL